MNRIIYLDHAATTPLNPLVREAMEPYLSEEYGNPSSIHRLGQRARMAVEEARETVANALNAEPAEIVFTSGGTESDNAAIRGLAFASGERRTHIVTTSIEHEAVLEACRDLQRQHGFAAAYVAPDRDGVVDVSEIERALRPDTVLVSVMHANNETGTIQRVRETAELCRERTIPFHTDAVQTAGTLPIDVRAYGVDLLSLSAHKFYGPKGVGTLFVRRGVAWQPQQLGGGQERLRRSGTENVAGIVGMAVALQEAMRDLSESAIRMESMRQHLLARLLEACPSITVNGSLSSRLPGNVNVSFPGLAGEAIVMAMDAQGVLLSTGSACASGSTEPSHVLEAIGASPEVATGAIRLTIGRENTWTDIREASDALVRTVRRLSGQGTVPGPTRQKAGSAT